MPDVSRSVRQLLTLLLSLNKVGAAKRRAAQRALAGDQLKRMRAMGRSLVADLIRDRELVRVQPNRLAQQPGRFFLLRRSGRLVDLSALYVAIKTPVEKSGRDQADPEHALPGAALRPEPTGPGGSADLDRLLAAMEQAQDLGIGEPSSGEPIVILEGILALLSRLLPEMGLFIWLPGEGQPEPRDERIFFYGPERREPTWLRVRDEGTAVWIPSWQELPVEIMAVLAADRAWGDFTGGKPGDFAGAAAVPLYEPREENEEEGARPGEAGLFCLVPRSRQHREVILGLCQRLARFVTRRWRHLRDVNLRIHTDSLTGVRNRGFFDTQLLLEVERARRGELPLTLVLADLDHFKQVNDRLGHQVGDVVLQMVARELQRGLRRIDHVCRIGGEEFALILPDTPSAAAQEVVGRLMTNLARSQSELPEQKAPLPVTLSSGMVTFPDGGVEAGELHRKADAMLYRSKHLGRNRCSIWNPRGEPLTLNPTDEPA